MTQTICHHGRTSKEEEVMNLQEFMSAGERLNADRRAVENLIEQAQNKLHHLQHVGEALRGLRRCWRDEDPGKYGEHWFLVRSYEIAPGDLDGHKRAGNIEKFWAIEVIDDAIEAQRGRKVQAYGTGESDRRPVPLGKLSDAVQEPCPHCKAQAAVVGRYCQTEDTPEGDLWQLDLSTLCLSCMTLEMFAKRVDGLRFF